MNYNVMDFDEVMFVLGGPEVPDNISPEQQQEIRDKFFDLPQEDQRRFKERLNERLFMFPIMVKAANKSRKKRHQKPLTAEEVAATLELIRRYSKLDEILRSPS